MQEIQLSASHWAFLVILLSILVSMAFRKGVIIPSILGIFVLGLLAPLGGHAYLNRFIFAAQVVYKALLNAGITLFPIMLVIALMIAMLRSLQAQGADRIMVAPMRKLMIGPWSAFFVLTATMYVAAVFFWPTPAVALIGTVLIPVAIRAGLPALQAAVAVNLAGHGTALAADPIIQGANRLSAAAAGIEPGILMPYTLLFSLVTGGVAISLACLKMRKELALPQAGPAIIAPIARPLTDVSDRYPDMPGAESSTRFAHAFAIAVPITLTSIALVMIYRAIFDPSAAILGGAATALLGGTATIILVVSTLAAQGARAMDGIVAHTRDGFSFAIRIFAPVIPIAGFFFLGNPDHAAAVIGAGTPGYLFDFGKFIGGHLHGNDIFLGFGVTLVAIITALDGVGFAGLPLTGSLAGALGTGADVSVPVLAALGQVVTIFTGSGTIVAWAFGACVDAGIAGVTPAQLVRWNFIPVMSGFLVTTVLAILMLR